MPVKKTKSMPDFTIEQKWMKKINGPVAGIDEAGRGPWAGPVTAAAVILDLDNIPAGLNDSKKLSEVRREQLFGEIMQTSIVGIGHASPDDIDQLNILRATMWAMKQAHDNLATAPKAILIDGNQRPDIDTAMETIIKGDAKSLSIAAASIIAKVTRDRLMGELDQKYPGFGWASNKGYGTKEHQNGIAAHGVTPHHRKSFAPIRRAIEAKTAG